MYAVNFLRRRKSRSLHSLAETHTCLSLMVESECWPLQPDKWIRDISVDIRLEETVLYHGQRGCKLGSGKMR